MLFLTALVASMEVDFLLNPYSAYCDYVANLIAILSASSLFLSHTLYNHSIITFCSPRNGGKGLFIVDWIDGGIDGFLGCELDFNPDSQAERTKPQHVHHDKSQ